MIYLDTSYIVKAYINEPHSDLVLDELAGQTGLTASSGTEKLYTHDTRMFEAAKTLGLNPIDIIPA